MYDLAAIGEDVALDGRTVFAVRSRGAVFPIMASDSLRRAMS